MLTALVVSLQAGTTFFSNGTTKWQVVVPKGSDKVVLYAAEELIQTLKKVSKIDFKSSSTSQKEFNIFLGTPKLSKDIAKVKLNLPKEDAIETVAVYLIGNNLYLAGNNSRAVLYSVYSFLTNQLGARWFWPGEDGEFIQPKDSYVFPDKLAYNFKPSFKIRAMSPCHWHRHVPTEIWMARNFLNGDSRTHAIRDKAGFYGISGGHRVIVYNAKKAFETNPELFAIVGGKPNRAGFVGCWSNPAFTKQVLENLITFVKKEKLDILNVFPGDTTIRCECAKCSAQGNRTDFWFRYYCNTIIPALKKEFPKLKFAGIAYQEYRTPPSFPLTNLEYVEYCHYNRCYAHKLTDPKCPVNQRSMVEIKKWTKIAPFGVYGYEFDVFKPNAMFANWIATQEAMRTYRSLKAVRVKTEMTVYYGKKLKRHELVPQMYRLSHWMWAQLSWNPDANVNALLKEWCDKVYGPKAANFMYKYYNELAQGWVKQKGHPNYFYRSPTGVAQDIFDARRIKVCRSLMNQALKAAADNPKHLEEIKLENKFFQTWEDYFKISGTAPTIIPPYQPNAKNFDNALCLPLQTKSDKIPAKDTSMKIYWDDKGVHIEAICMEPNMASLRKSSTKRDGDVWKDDSIEIMVDTGDGNSVRHMVVTAGNNRYDAIANDPSWNPKWDSKVKLESNRWIATISLPFATMGNVTPNTSWKFVIIRNSKPGAIGFPKPAHQDIDSGSVIFFRKNATKPKMLVWITGKASTKLFNTYRKFFFDNNWSFLNVIGEEEVGKLNLIGVDLIYVNPFKTKFDKAFWANKITPAINNGSTFVLHNYFWLYMLGKGLGDDTFVVKNVANPHKILKPVTIDPKFNAAKHDLKKTYKSCGIVTLAPKHPNKWKVLMTQMTKDNKEAPAVLYRPMGKGKVFLIAQPRGGIHIFENMVEYRP